MLATRWVIRSLHQQFKQLKDKKNRIVINNYYAHKMANDYRASYCNTQNKKIKCYAIATDLDLGQLCNNNF